VCETFESATRPAAPGSSSLNEKRRNSGKVRKILRGEHELNKTELIEHIAKQADVSKAAASRSLEALIGAVKTTLKKGGNVTITGFGTFTAPKRAARVGRNPRTGAAIKIKAAKVPKFRPGKGLRDAL